MKIIIVGCGKIGKELARVLSQEGDDITVIDKNEAVVEELCSKYDIMGTVGNGASFSVQMEAEITQADLMIATTGSDELNLLACLTARMAGHVHTIARLRNPDYNGEIEFLKEELGLAMVINQEATAAREIARVLKFPSAIEIDTFAKGRIELLRFKIPEKSLLDGLSLTEMHSKVHSDVLVCTVERSGEITIPNGDYKLQAGDVISVVGDATSEESFFRKIGIHTNKVKNVIIVGGGDIAFYLAKMLLEYGIHVKIIEKKLDRCEFLSDELPKAYIIHGNRADQQLPLEEGIDSTEGFVTLTDIDEENTILSLYARSMGVRKIVTKVNFLAFDEVFESLDLDTTVHPRDLTAEYIMQYVRARKNAIGNNVETMHWIVDGKAEALEFHIRETFSNANIPLQDLRIRKNILVACINRENKTIIPRGRDVLQIGDTVVVVTTIRGLDDITDIFEE